MKTLQVHPWIDTKIAQLTDLRARYALTLNELNKILPEIEAQITKLGLKIEDIGHHKTGVDSEIWNESDALSVTITATPVSETSFRFLTFRGYTARGESTNAKARDLKARKMEDAIGFGASVNEFSLEVKRDQEHKSVLITLTVKESA